MFGEETPGSHGPSPRIPATNKAERKGGSNESRSVLFQRRPLGVTEMCVLQKCDLIL